MSNGTNLGLIYARTVVLLRAKASTGLDTRRNLLIHNYGIGGAKHIDATTELLVANRSSTQTETMRGQTVSNLETPQVIYQTRILKRKSDMHFAL